MALDRKAIRFQPDPLTVALIDLKNGKHFNPKIVALVLNESYTGCSLILSSDENLHKGDKVKIKIGHLNAMKAQIAWIKNLEENILKVGIKLLE